MIETSMSALPAGFSSEQAFRVELAQLPRLSDAQEAALAQRARAGDQKAREEMVCALLPAIARMARRYGRLVRHAEYLDVCQYAAMVAWENLAVALEKERPFAYLNAVARTACARFLYLNESLIVKRCVSDWGKETPRIESLDVAVEVDGEEGELTYLGALCAQLPVESEQAPVSNESHYVALYEALTALTVRQREVIERNFGLYGRPQETLRDIDVSLTGRYDPNMNTAFGRKNKALRALRRQFEERCA